MPTPATTARPPTTHGTALLVVTVLVRLTGVGPPPPPDVVVPVVVVPPPGRVKFGHAGGMVPVRVTPAIAATEFIAAKVTGPYSPSTDSVELVKEL